jgi:hypothetical protein
MRNSIMLGSIRRVAIVALGASALAASPAAAQSQSAGPRWSAWIGCWQAVQPGGEYGSAEFAPPMVCITPTSEAEVVKVSTIVGTKVVQEDVIDASGRERAIETKGCTGTQRATWSSDGRRVFLKAQATCDGTRTSTSAILSMTPQGEWIDVRNVVAGEGNSVRVAKYRDMGISSKIPPEVAATLTGRSVASQGARIAAGAQVGAVAIVEAVKASDSLVVASWLLERGQPFSLSAESLLTLAEAGVPGSVTDAMVAVSNPSAFATARADQIEERNDGRRRTTVFMEPAWGYSPYGYGYGYGYGYNNYYGYGRYGSGYGYGGYYGGSPIIIVTNSEAAAARGQVVKGRGYTQGPGSSNSGNRGTASERTSSPSSSSTNSSSGSNTSTQSQPAQTETRTAKPRP